ncbi:MAG: VIT domain-containing protein [Planctomycetota bacterium]
MHIKHLPIRFGACLLMSITALLTLAVGSWAAEKTAMPGGALHILKPDGQTAGACPLKHTDVQADIAGFVGRVTVRQVFHNPTEQKIEAVYVFPLPQDAAVDDMVMTVGDRRIVGQIKEREEAREIYEAAKAAGHVASLLDQERPNIFTQSVANIEPGVEVTIEISYTETLKYEDGLFEWVFPMVVGPRYIPGGGSAPDPMTTGTPTAQVPDADKITPPVTPKGTRAGHDISLTVTIDAGIPVEDAASELHEIEVTTPAGRPAGAVCVTLKNQATIPNKDFILRYRLAPEGIGDAFLTHHDERGDFFTLVLQPPRRIVPAELMSRELIFVLDTSGSMSGFPIEAAKQVMAKAIDQMRPGDTFNMITFAGDTHVLWEQPRAATPENITEAQAFLVERRGGGGTEMMKAINAALFQPEQHQATILPIRVVCFMTDGYVGNDMAIIDAVKQNAGTTRVFSFGIGNGVNRFLLDGMALAGRGEVEYVTLESNAAAAAERFHERILAPVLTDISIDWGDLPVADVYPKLIPDLFSAKPIMIHGRLTGPAVGTIKLHGNTGTGPYESIIDLDGSATGTNHPVLPSLWARAKIADLMMQDYEGLQNGNLSDELKREITALGIDFRLMTQFTSFVAVEEMTVTVGGEPVKVNVPVEMPEGVSYEGVFGGGGVSKGVATLGKPMTAMSMSRGRGAVAGMGARRSARREVQRSSGNAPGIFLNGDVGPEETDAAAGLEPASKLAEPLGDLAEKVEKEAQDGNLAVGKLQVTDYRVDVMIFLSDLSDETLAALEKLGFEQSEASRTIKLLIGTIDVRKLAELAELNAVIRVKPVVEP